MSQAAATVVPGDTENKPSGFGPAFWVLNAIEMFERLAYFGIRAVVPLYIMQATEPGGLHLTAVHKGWIYMWWAILQSWLPMFTGGFADRYGYKRVLFFAISANALGYFIMAFLHSYEGFFVGILVLAAGTAFFKPSLQGSLAQNLDRSNSSMGWGIFYWVVNVGAFGAPIFATAILGTPHTAAGWRTLFIASGLYTCVNLVLLLLFRDVPSGADKSESLIDVMSRTVENIWPFWFTGGRLHARRGPVGIALAALGLCLFIVYEPIAALFASSGLALPEAYVQGAGGAAFLLGALLATWLEGGRFQWQLRLPVFLLIMSCFWMMMYQLWDLHPNFITDWVDSSMVAPWMPAAWREYGDRGLIQVPQQILLNLNAGLIIVLVVPISWFARKMRTLSAMLVGMSVATLGILVAGLTPNGWILLLGIVFFSLGEMWTGPKKNEYLALIAPPGKKGLYLGYVNIPVGIGVGIGSWIAGVVYDNYGEKATLALKELGSKPALLAKAAQGMDWSDALHLAPKIAGFDRDQALTLTAAAMGLSEDSAATALRTAFQHDEGQTTNLALIHVAQEERHRIRVQSGLKTVDGSAPGAGSADLVGRLAAHVHLVPKWTDCKRFGALDEVRMTLNKTREPTEQLGRRETAAWFWERYGLHPRVVNNLAIEYLAQATNTIRDAVADMSFKNPVKEIPERIGLGRTKSFEALSAALGVEWEEVAQQLGTRGLSSPQSAERLYVLLAGKDQVRFAAVARRDWTADIGLLRELVSSDTSAQAYAEQNIHRRSAKEAIVATLSWVFGGERDDESLYDRLARKTWLIQEVLAKRDWSANPGLAAAVLQLNPSEAQRLAVAESNNAQLIATQQLWRQYNPQYAVWIPFACVGVVATIALAIFGQMAKRWKDMNA